MRVEKADSTTSKGWTVGPWNSDLSVANGFANQGVAEPHLHQHLTEIYLVGRGTSTLRLEQRTPHLEPGDIVVVEPGEAHTSFPSSPDYFHFVLHVPGPAGWQSAGDKRAVARSRLGL